MIFSTGTPAVPKLSVSLSWSDLPPDPGRLFPVPIGAIAMRTTVFPSGLISFTILPSLINSTAPLFRLITAVPGASFVPNLEVSSSFVLDVCCLVTGSVCVTSIGSSL